MLTEEEILDLINDVMHEKGFVPYHVVAAKEYANIEDGLVREKDVRDHLDQALRGTAPDGSSAALLRKIYRDSKK